MSGAVDTKTVEMRFDNSNFESNAKRSISTLEKLKSALKLDGASKGLSDIEKASEKLDFKDVDHALDTVGKKFSWLEQIGIGVLRRIGEQAVNAGEKLLKSFTVDPLSSGWNKYESKTTSVQTIMANLRDETNKFIDDASKMDYVTERIEKLNWYADETSYSLTDMTNTVGKLVAQGLELDSSVQAAMGISNLAAISGQTAAEANRVMYNVAQAMGSGAMKAIDWKSLENANMATAELRQTAIQIAQDKGKIKEGQVTIENFRDSLSSGWFDKEVMMATFEEYGSAIDKVQAKIDEVAESNDGLEITASKALKMLAAEDAQFAKSLGYRAFKAAQEAKTFHEALNATSDAVSSKWMSVFENIFGNYLQQRELWTDLANDLWDVFAAPVDRLSSIFESWNEGIDGISGRTHLIEGFKNVFNSLVHSVMDDETGKVKRYSIFDTIKNGFKEVFGLDKEAKELGKSLWNLTKKFKEFTEKLIPTEETLEKIKNSFKGLFTIFKIGGKFVNAIIKPFKNLFNNVFKNGLSSILDITDGFGTMIQRFDEFLEENKVFDAISDGISWGLQKIGEGLDFVTNALAGVSFKEFISNLKTKVLNFFTNFDFNEGFGRIGAFFGGIVEQIKAVKTENLTEKLTPLQNFYVGICNIFGGIKSFFASIAPSFRFVTDWIRRTLSNIGEAIATRDLSRATSRFAPIIEGVKSVFKGVGDFFSKIGPTLKKIGDWIGEGLGKIGDAIAKFAENKSAAEIIQSIVKGGFILALTNLVNSIAGLNFGKKGVLKSLKGDLDAIRDVLKAYQKEVNVQTLVDLALAIGILSGAMWVLAQIPTEKLDSVVDALWNIAEVLAGFTILKEVIKSLTKANQVMEGKDPDSLFGKIRSLFLGVVQTSIFANDATAKFVKISLGIMFAAIAAKQIADAVGKLGEALVKIGKEQDEGALKRGGKAVAQIVAVFGAFALMAGFSNKLGSSLVAALSAFIVIKAIAKLINLMAEIGADAKKIQSIKNFLNAFDSTFETLGNFILKFIGIIALAEVLMAAFSVGAEGFGLSATIKQFGKNFLRIAASLALVAAAVLIISKTEYTQADIANCAIVFGGFIALTGLLQIVMAAVSANSSGKDSALPKILKQFGNNFIKIAASLAVVALAVKMIAGTPYTQGDMANCAIIFGGFIALTGIAQIAMAAVSENSAGKDSTLPSIMKVFGNNFLKIAGSLALVALAVKMIAGLPYTEGDMKNCAWIFGGFLAIAGIIAGVSMYLSTKETTDTGKIIASMAGIAGVMLASAASLLIVSKAVEMMQGLHLSPAEAVIIGTIFGAFLTIVGLFGTLSGALTKEWSGAVAIAAIAGSYIAAAYALQLLAGAFSQMQGITDLGQLAVIAIIFGAFIGLVGMFGSLAGEFTSNWQGVAAIATIAVSYIAAAYSLQLLAVAFQEMQSVAESANINEISGLFGTFIVVVGAFGLLAGVVGDNWSSVAAMGVMAVSFIAAAVSLKIVAESLKALCEATSVDQLHEAGEIMTAFLLLVGILGAIGGLLGTVGGVGAILGMAGIAAVIISIGAACLMAGAGIGIAAAGLGLLAGALALLVEALAIYGPAAAAAVGIMVNAILDTIISAAPKLAQAAIALITAFAAGLIGSADVLAAAAFVLLITLLNTFATGIPALAQAIVGLISSALNTIAEVIRASAYIILPAVMNILSAIVELVLEVLAELVGAIPGVGDSLATEIRGWKDGVNDAMLSVFGDAESIGQQGAESVISGFSGGGAGKSFSEAGASGVKEIMQGAASVDVKPTGEAIAADLSTSMDERLRPRSHGKKIVKDMSEGMEEATPLLKLTADKTFSEVPKSFDSNSVTSLDSLKNMFSDMGLEIGEFDMGGLMDGQFGGFITSLSNGSDLSLESFTSMFSGMEGILGDFDLGGLMSGKMAEGNQAISDNVEPAKTATKEVTSAIESEFTSVDSYSWGYDAGSQYGEGISAAVPIVEAAARAMAAAVSAFLHFSEPDVGPLSDFHTYAPDMIKLWCSGVYSNLNKVEDSSNAMADTVYDGFSTALEYVSGLIDNGMSDELAIRPVMDLSGIQNGIRNLDSMVGGANGYTISGSTRLASSAAYSMGTRLPTAAEQAPAVAGAGVNNYNTFNITNDDPQAVAQKVSRILDQGAKREQAVWAR